MAFQVYPTPQTAALNVAASATSALVTINELVGVDPVTTLNTMFLRVVKIGTGCAASGAPHPTIRLKANTGDAVVVPTFPTTASIFNLPGGTGVEVANVTLQIEANDVYYIRAFILQAGSNWQIQFTNNDGVNAHGFTWVVADSDAQTQQPWIDMPTALAFDVLTGQAVPLSVQVANLGTGPLTIADAVGFSPGAGYALTTVPGAINPNACANLQITFTGPAAPGASNAIYTATSNDSTAQLAAGHNRRINLTAATRKLEVMLLVDASGSMNAKPDGTPAVAATDSRWSKLGTAANQFLDLLSAFGGGSGRFGVARFPDMGPCPSSADIQTATDISAANVNVAKAALAANVTGDMTPMGHGIGRVIGTGAGSFGYFESSANSQNFNRRWLVLMSDGAHNCSPPAPADFFGAGATSFQGKKVKVIAVGYGDPGAAIYAPDHVLLNDIKNASGPDGQFLDAGFDDTGMGLLKSFRTALATGLTLNPTVDPGGVLTTGQREVRRTIAITPYETKAAFVVNWATPDAQRVRVEILTPLCELITPSVAQRDPNIEFADDPRYTIYTFNDSFLRNSADPARPRYGDWTLIIAADDLQGGDSEQFEYEVIFDSRLKMNLALNRTQYFTGDTIVLTAQLALDGQPVRGASVTCRFDAPGQSSDNWLAQNSVTAAELEKARAALLTPDANALTVKALALQLKGLKFIPVKAATTATLNETSAGAYEAGFTQTTTPGTFDFTVTAVGTTADGIAFRREKQLQTRVEVRPEPECTIYDTSYRQVVFGQGIRFISRVRVWPMDCFGNYYLVDPAVTPVLNLTVKGAEPTGPLVSNFDGSYSQALSFEEKARPVVTLALEGRKFTAKLPVFSPGDMIFADTVFAFEPGREARPGLNKHINPRAALGKIGVKDRDEFLALGAFGSVVYGFEGQVINRSRDEDVTVFVRGDEEELRPYRVEALSAGKRPRWVLLGESPGVTQAFSLRKASIQNAFAIRITDSSGRTRSNKLEESSEPGAKIMAVGVRRTSKLPEQELARFTELLRAKGRPSA